MSSERLFSPWITCVICPIIGLMTKALHGGSAIPSWTMADRLRKAREHAGLEQTELAELIGASRKTIGRAEGGAAVRRTTLIAWAFACGVDLHWVETGETPPSDGDGGASTVRPKGLEPLTS